MKIIYTLLGLYALACFWIGIELSTHSIWILIAFILLGIITLQAGFFTALILRG